VNGKGKNSSLGPGQSYTTASAQLCSGFRALGALSGAVSLSFFESLVNGVRQCIVHRSAPLPVSRERGRVLEGYRQTLKVNYFWVVGFQVILTEFLIPFYLVFYQSFIMKIYFFLNEAKMNFILKEKRN
jgi:hypothetical protein